MACRFPRLFSRNELVTWLRDYYSEDGLQDCYETSRLAAESLGFCWLGCLLGRLGEVSKLQRFACLLHNRGCRFRCRSWIICVSVLFVGGLLGRLGEGADEAQNSECFR